MFVINSRYSILKAGDLNDYYEKQKEQHVHSENFVMH